MGFGRRRVALPFPDTISAGGARRGGSEFATATGGGIYVLARLFGEEDLLRRADAFVGDTDDVM